MKKITIILALAVPLLLQARDMDVRKTGAKADGKTVCTAAIQKAIDQVSESGGGRVILSGGTFLSGSLTLKSGVELFIDADATLLASSDINDFPVRDIKHCNGPETFPRYSNKCFILADEAENIAICGRGTIDCNGDRFVREKTGEDWVGLRYERILPNEQSLPRVVFLAGCRNVTVTDIRMTGQPGGWTFWVSDCDYVSFDRCSILANVEYPNNDGIHINCSRNVSVSNCHIETGDDCIVVRALSRTLKESRECRGIVVSNCTLKTPCYGIRIGYTGDGVVRDCTFSNLVFSDCFNGIGIQLPERRKNDYGFEESVIDNLVFSNIVMSGISHFPIEVVIYDNPETPVKFIGNIRFSNITCTARCFPTLKGRKSNYIENVTFDNCSFTQIPYEESGCLWRKQTEYMRQTRTDFVTKYCRNIIVSNTVFNTL